MSVRSDSISGCTSVPRGQGVPAYQKRTSVRQCLSRCYAILGSAISRDLLQATNNNRSPTTNGTIAVGIDIIADITVAPIMMTISKLAANGVSPRLMPVSQGTMSPMPPKISQIPMKCINHIGKATGAPSFICSADIINFMEPENRNNRLSSI